MKPTILLYGFVLAVLMLLLKLIEYRFLVHRLSLEVYLGIIAVLFAGVGVWAGWKFTHQRPMPLPVNEPSYQPDTVRLEKIGISRREYEVLELMAQGFSNQEIADRLFVSLNTVKTHSSNLFLKLGARRRTQAVRKAKELSLIA